MKKNLFLTVLMALLVPVATMMAQEQGLITPAPVINVYYTDDSVIIEAEGEGEVHLYMGSYEVENPYYAERDIYDWSATFRATAQIEGMEMSETSMVVSIPTKGHFTKTIRPLVYAHHVDAEKGLALRIVNCAGGDRGDYRYDYVDFFPYVYDDYCFDDDPNNITIANAESFYYQINDTGQYEEFQEYVYLKDYGEYTIRAYSSNRFTNDSEIITATVKYDESGFTSHCGNYLVHDGLLYYVSDEDNTVAAADYYFYTFYLFYYPMIAPQKSGDIVIPEVIHSQGRDYTVKSIGFCALSGFSSAFIPSTVTHFNYMGFDSAIGDSNNLISLEVDEDNPVFDSRDNCNAVIETATNTLVLGCQNTVIPHSVSSIGVRSFESCTPLTDIILPETVTSIGESAFKNCTGLTRVICQSVIPPVTGGNCFDYYRPSTLFVPYESLEVYRAHEEWGHFSRIVPFLGAGPGDVNGDGHVNISDVTGLINVLLKGGDLPAYCDVNGDGQVTISDVTALINMLLRQN